MSSSSGDEFGSLGPTTPLVPTKKTVTRTTKSTSNRAVPGPSSKPAPTKGRPKNLKRTPSASPGIEVNPPDVPTDEDAEDIIALSPPPKGKQPSSRSETTATNARQTAKGKGKAQAGPSSKSSKKVVPALEPMDVDDIEIIDKIKAEAFARETAEAINNATGVPRGVIPTRSAKNHATSTELEHLRQKAANAEARAAALSKQLEEAFLVRSTEAEQLLERQIQQYEARIEKHETTIQELTSQLARVEPLSRAGKSSVLHLLTREAADEEKRIIEKELTRWKDMAAEKDRVIADKDKRIAELEQIEKDLRLEVSAEIKRSTALASRVPRVPPSASRGRPGQGILTPDDPKHAEVIKFYEDLTNLLVPNMKLQPTRHFDLEEWSFTCIYTYVEAEDRSDDVDEPRKGKSLSFTLLFCYDPDPNESGPVTSPEQLKQTVHYTPLELDKESSDFVRKLDFLGEPFKFGREQLPVFLNTIYTKMGDASKDGEDEDFDDEPEMVGV